MLGTLNWIKAQWDAFHESYDREEVLDASSPKGVPFVLAGMLATFAAMAFLPPIADQARFQHPWISMLLAVAGSALTLVAYYTRVSGIGRVATLLDNTCYSAAFVFAATHSSEIFGITLTAIHAVVIVSFQARQYPLSLFSVPALSGPTILFLALDSSPPLKLLLFATLMMVTTMQYGTTKRLHRARIAPSGVADTSAATRADAAEPASAATDRLGTVLRNRWLLQRVLGIGGMGTVFEASDDRGEHVAIKMLHREFIGARSAFRVLQREARAARSIPHASVVQVTECNTDEQGVGYLVMELLEGESLQQRLEREHRLPPSEATWIGQQLLQVLICAHDAGVLHRDLKPSNLFLTQTGELKVLDFGLARVITQNGASPDADTQTGSLVLLGTPAYMPPEVARGRSRTVDVRSDVWATGAILFALLTGRPVHQGGTINELFGAAMTRSAPSIRVLAPDSPLELAEVIDRALRYHPAERFQTAREMLDALSTSISQEPTVEMSGQQLPSSGEATPLLTG